MTANQRRPGFRLPWTSEEEGEAAPATAPGAAPEAVAPAGEAAATPVTPNATPEAVETETGGPPVAAEPAPAADAEPPQEFLRELVAAMRKVADESKQTGLADARARAEERVKQLEAEGDRRRQELNTRAEADIAAVGEWAKAEAERIKAEAERRVTARRAQLDEQLAADQARGQADAKAVRGLVSDYERELEAYHAQLAEITDPAAFAAAAKRMPRPPALDAATPAAPAPARATTADVPAPAAAETLAADASPASTNGQAATAEVHPAEEEVLAARLAELDASLPAEPAAQTTPAPAATATGTADTTEVVVSGLGSFGAITSFRQSLADVDGVQGVALSLGGSGEFVFRATHRPGFDLGAAIAALEGDAATVQPRPEGGLLVKLERRR
jgi:hypothetical protein